MTPLFPCSYEHILGVRHGRSTQMRWSKLLRFCNCSGTFACVVKTDTGNVSETLEGCPNLKVACSPCHNDDFHGKTPFWQGLQSTFRFGHPSSVSDTFLVSVLEPWHRNLAAILATVAGPQHCKQHSSSMFPNHPFLREAIQIQMRAISSSSSRSPERGGMRNSSR